MGGKKRERERVRKGFRIKKEEQRRLFGGCFWLFVYLLLFFFVVVCCCCCHFESYLPNALSFAFASPSFSKTLPPRKSVSKQRITKKRAKGCFSPLILSLSLSPSRSIFLFFVLFLFPFCLGSIGNFNELTRKKSDTIVTPTLCRETDSLLLYRTCSIREQKTLFSLWNRFSLSLPLFLCYFRSYSVLFGYRSFMWKYFLKYSQHSVRGLE